MIPFKLDIAPAVLELSIVGKVSPNGMAATMVLLAGKGYLCFFEMGTDSYGIELRMPVASPNLDELESLLFGWLQDWKGKESGQDFFAERWAEWDANVRQIASSTGLHNTSSTKRGWFASILSRSHRPVEGLGRIWSQAAKSLEKYPEHDDPLPSSREEWDALFAFSVALGMATGFLGRVRKVCEYYEQNFEGIIINFFTPRWYIGVRNAEQKRFNFLTEGLDRLFGSFRCDNLMLMALEDETD